MENTSSKQGVARVLVHNTDPDCALFMDQFDAFVKKGNNEGARALADERYPKLYDKFTKAERLDFEKKLAQLVPVKGLATAMDDLGLPNPKFKFAGTQRIDSLRSATHADIVQGIRGNRAYANGTFHNADQGRTASGAWAS